ncbi:hypothetical protein [Paenibacillus humicola]|uniref:hypothetical protein n=1 Tax=Paenibacillus humicola TaxID=3110540 RepID=UPI00237A5E88|nr:hypothetical protein [Paenibacillus humicola]
MAERKRSDFAQNMKRFQLEGYAHEERVEKRSALFSFSCLPQQLACLSVIRIALLAIPRIGLRETATS